MTQLLVRPMTVDDVDAVARLHVSTWRETYIGLLPESFFSDDVVEYRRRWWAATIADTEADQVFRVAELDAELVGFAGAGVAVKDPALRPRELYMIYLTTAAHGTGLASSCSMRFSRRFLPPSGWHVIILEHGHFMSRTGSFRMARSTSIRERPTSSRSEWCDKRRPSALGSAHARCSVANRGSRLPSRR